MDLSRLSWAPKDARLALVLLLDTLGLTGIGQISLGLTVLKNVSGTEVSERSAR